ncbi:hypothetical protein ACEQMU_004803 [Salmonella enterica]
MRLMHYLNLAALPLLAGVTLSTAAAALVISATVGLELYAGYAWNEILADGIMAAVFGGVSWWTFSNLQFCVRQLHSKPD